MPPSIHQANAYRKLSLRSFVRHHTGKELKIQELNSERFRAIEPDAATLPYLTEEQMAVLEQQREEAREERDFDMLIIAISLLDKVWSSNLFLTSPRACSSI